MEFNKGTGINYVQNCKKIDEYIKKIELLHCSHNNKAETINSLQNQLATFETELLTAEQKALLAIKEKYQVSNDIWQKYTADLHRMKTIYTKNMQKAHPAAIHDPNIPANILETLIALLQHNGINPQSVHIKMVTDQKEIDENSTTIAQAKSYVTFTLSDKSEQNFISYNYESPTIEIFPQMLTKTSMTNIMSTCAHEIRHIIQHHSLTKSILRIYLRHYYNITYTELEATDEHHKLAQIHEAQAEILSAIKDPKIAECLKIDRQETYYPGHLYEEHFFQIAYIDMLWKTHEGLEYFSAQQFSTNI
jgi:hypothetical protein